MNCKYCDVLIKYNTYCDVCQLSRKSNKCDDCRNNSDSGPWDKCDGCVPICSYCNDIINIDELYYWDSICGICDKLSCSTCLNFAEDDVYCKDCQNL